MVVRSGLLGLLGLLGPASSSERLDATGHVSLQLKRATSATIINPCIGLFLEFGGRVCTMTHHGSLP